jgi:hypothetical protein
MPIPECTVAGGAVEQDRATRSLAQSAPDELKFCIRILIFALAFV